MPQLNDYVPETASHTNVENQFDVLNLLSENQYGQSNQTKDLPDVQLEDSVAQTSQKGGCISTHTLEFNFQRDSTEEHLLPQKNDWLRDGSIDVEDAQVLKKLFEKANQEGGAKGEQKMLNSINQKLEDDGSDYRVSIIKSSGNTRTFQLSRLNDTKCGPSEIPVDAERIHLGNQKPRPKLEKGKEPKDGEKKPAEKSKGHEKAKKLGKKSESNKNVSKYDKYSKTRDLEEQLTSKFKMFKEKFS